MGPELDFVSKELVQPKGNRPSVEIHKLDLESIRETVIEREVGELDERITKLVFHILKVVAREYVEYMLHESL